MWHRSIPLRLLSACVVFVVYAVGAAATAATVAAGSGHAVLVTPDGHVWMWGRNTNGQLGDGTLTQRTSPVQVPGLTGVIAVAAGANHTLALTQDARSGHGASTRPVNWAMARPHAAPHPRW